MFGPNTVGSYQYEVWNSHRDIEFENLFLTLQGMFQDIFSLREYDILFIPGSGTAGIEAVISSLNNPLKIIGPEGKFQSRWSALAKHYHDATTGPNEMFCQLETSTSEIFYRENCIVDAVSSFPYYQIPKNTKVFITCCNKQLGAFPGVSIVGVRKDCWDMFKSSEIFSYLNLFLYKKYAKINQTPTTPPIALLEHLLAELSVLNINSLRSQVDYVSGLVVDAIGVDNFIGETRCPVLTFKKESISDKLAKEWSLYGYGNSSTLNYQIFTYSHPIEDYCDFVEEILNESS